jgi:cellulose synthase/poly-beta-1,6-N-acetylglucosamine synthase-like glycosyltransferase
VIAASVFTGSLALVGYTYVGYPLLALARARLAPRPIRRAPIRPRVTVVVAAWREAAHIERKLKSLAEQTYPAALFDVVVACDGSDDGTDEIARAVGERLMPGRVRVVMVERGGKPRALNAGVAASTGEVLVMTDARQPLSPGAIQALVEDLGDPEVGVVGGELVLEGDAPVGAYWKYEAFLRRLEGTYGSTIGVSGALYAIRRELMAPIPEETILDDVLVPMRARLAGKRVVFEPEAKAYDRAVESAREFRRKVRTLSGNFQLLAILPELLVPWKNPSWLDFVSHKLLRLAVPYALLGAFGSSWFVAPPLGPLLGAAQAAGYGLAAARALGVRLPLSGLAETVVVLNAAAVAGALRFVRHGRALPWT